MLYSFQVYIVSRCLLYILNFQVLAIYSFQVLATISGKYFFFIDSPNTFWREGPRFCDLAFPDLPKENRIVSGQIGVEHMGHPVSWGIYGLAIDDGLCALLQTYPHRRYGCKMMMFNFPFWWDMLLWGFHSPFTETRSEMENPMMSVSSPCSKLQAPRPFPQVMVGFLLGKTLKKIGIRLARLLSSERNTFQKVLPVWNTHSFDMQTEASRNDTSYQKIKPPCPIPLNPSCLIMEFSSLAIRILYDKG